MGNYNLSTQQSDSQNDGRPVWQSSGTQTAGQYLYWLSAQQQWNIGSPVGYNDPYMKVNDNVATPENTATWQSRQDNENNYQNDPGVQVKCMDTNDNNNKKKKRTGEIAGIAVGSLLVVGLAAAGVLMLLRPKKADDAYVPTSSGFGIANNYVAMENMKAPSSGATAWADTQSNPNGQQAF
jgi:hypothetical protein